MLRVSRLYPAFLDLSGRPVLVAGGGAVAARKARGLRAAGARVTVVAPAIRPGFPRVARVRRRRFRVADLRGMRLVFAATDDRFANALIARAALRRGIPVNVVDDPDACSFLVPAVVRRGDLLLAVGTSGASPAIARSLRRALSGAFDLGWARRLARARGERALRLRLRTALRRRRA